MVHSNQPGWRVHGMAVRAMADGTVCWALNDHDEWTDLKTRDAIVAEAEKKAKAAGTDKLDRSAFPQSPTAGYVGGGNQIFVKSGDEVWVLAHLQRGSIPPELLTPGAPVKRGQYLGKAGFSGDTSWPAPHIHVKTEHSDGAPNKKRNMNNSDNGTTRPMTFTDMFCTPKDESVSDAKKGKLAESAWTKLSNHSAPDSYGLLYPADTPLDFVGSLAPGMLPAPVDDLAYVALWHPGDHIDLRVQRPGFPAFVRKFDDLTKNDSFRLRTIETCFVYGRQQFMGTFERGTGKHFLSQFSTWKAFVDHAGEQLEQGCRLTDVCTYVEAKTRWFVGVYRTASGGRVPIRVKGLTDFTDQCDDLHAQDVHLVSVDAYVDADGDTHCVGVLRGGTGAQKVKAAVGWKAFTKIWSDLGQGASPLRLTDVSSTPAPKPAPRIYIGVFHPDAAKQGQILEGVTGYEAFLQRSERHRPEGFRLARLHVEKP